MDDELDTVRELEDRVAHLRDIVIGLEDENKRFKRALEQIKDADKCNFATDGVSLATRLAKEALL